MTPLGDGKMMQKKILVVDDENLLREMVTSRLQSDGYDVIQAVDGKEGLEKVKKERPDLVILDIMLPKMNGYEVCGLLKSDPQYNEIPVILFSSKSQESDKELGSKVGADAYITKLFGGKEIFKKIKEFIE